MEYALLALYYGIQKLFNMFMNFEIKEGVNLGGILISYICLSLIFTLFGLVSSENRRAAKHNKSKGED